ncbi:MAG: energy transducer TonB [Candidatus Eremiobacteraeota bacterium]|nr:energy transducer TonB [Candidatus Eremiobacteraeota bacterium]
MSRRPFAFIIWLLAACVASANGLPARSAGASAAQTATLDGVALGAPIQAVVKALGTPGLVATTDDGHEWRWYDAGGLDVDLLADNALLVRQVLVGRPQALNGATSKLVQPREFPVLEQPASTAAAFMKSIGAVRQTEPEDTVSAWHVGDHLVVLELISGAVHKIFALDAASASHLGYIPGTPAPHFHAPRLLGQFAVDYPKRAIERRAQGVVVVEVSVQASGSVKDVHILVSSGDPDIDAAETLSMRRSKFQPALCDGQPCDSIYLDREDYTLPL